MFYSQYILAKKGPLGTIWIAAHLERKLRKNQVTETDIPTSVDSILFPEVPIALRLSGHLLLGVVRIYSRKVNYLFHDCNEALVKLKTAFSSASVDLPPEASRAPFHAITLPEAFDFDDMDIFPQSEDVFYITDVLDQHVTTRDLITLEEPMEDDAYPGSQFEQDERFVDAGTPHAMGHGSNEEFLLKRHRSRDLSTLEPLLQEDVLPPMPMDIDTGPSTSTYSPNFEAEAQHDQSLPKVAAENETPGTLSNEVVPDVEKLRSLADAVEDDLYGFGKERGFQHVGKEPSTLKSPVEERLVEDDQFMLRTPVSGPALSPLAQLSRDNPISGTEVLAGVLDGTPALGVVETPVPKRRTRKRKPTYDLEVQLQNSYMRDLLKHSSDLRRVRKKVAHTQEEIWLSEKERLGKRIFSKPSVPGLCSGLEDLYDRMFNAKRQKTPSVSSAPRAVRIESPPDVPEANEQLHSDRPLTPARIQDEAGIAPEVRGENEVVSNLPDASPLRTVTDNVDYGTPPSGGHTGTGMETPLDCEATDATRELRSKAAQERLSNRLNMSTEKADIGHDPVFVSGTEEEIPVADVELEPDHHVDAIDSSLLLESIEPASVSEGAKRMPQNEGWSVRTRAIAEFLRATFEDMEKRPQAEDSPKLSLDRLVGGKTRKEAARMFFETLVLRTNNYILTQQEAPYNEIDIYPQAMLMKAVF